MNNVSEIKTHKKLQQLIKKGASVYVAIQGMPHVTIKAVKSDVLAQSKARQEACLKISNEDKLRDYDGQEKVLYHYTDHGEHGAIYLDGAF